MRRWHAEQKSNSSDFLIFFSNILDEIAFFKILSEVLKVSENFGEFQKFPRPVGSQIWKNLYH